MPDRLTWNPWLRWGLGRERLAIWLFHFVRRIDRDAIQRAFEEVLGQNAVTSYSLHEVLGSYDHVLEMWVPYGTSTLKMDETLYAHLRKTLDPYVETDFFEVEHILNDGKWEDLSTLETRSGSPAFAPGQPDLRYLNADELHPDEIANIKVLEDRGSRQEEREAAIDWASKIGLARTENRVPRLRLYFVIAPPTALAALGQHKFTYEVRSHVRSAIAEALTNAAGLMSPQPLTEAAFYEGHGMALYIGFVAIDLSKFFLILPTILSSINSAVASETAKVYTIVAADSSPLMEQDILRVWKAPTGAHRDEPRRGIPFSSLRLPSQAESAELEFKSSIALDVRRLVIGDGVIASNPKVTRSIVKCVSAMLNHQHSCTLVIGLTEVLKLFESVALESVHEAALRSARFEPVEDARDLWICPLHLDAQMLKVQGGDEWDAYQGKLQRILFDQISPAPAGLVTIAPHEFAPGRWLAVASIASRSDQMPWYYVDKSEFWVRDGANSRQLTGTDADHYKTSHGGVTFPPDEASPQTVK